MQDFLWKWKALPAGKASEVTFALMAVKWKCSTSEMSDIYLRSLALCTVRRKQQRDLCTRCDDEQNMRNMWLRKWISLMLHRHTHEGITVVCVCAPFVQG